MPSDLEVLLRRVTQEARSAVEARDPRASACHAAMAEAYRARADVLLRGEAEPAQSMTETLAEMPARYRRGFAILHGVAPERSGFLADLAG